MNFYSMILLYPFFPPPILFFRPKQKLTTIYFDKLCVFLSPLFSLCLFSCGSAMFAQGPPGSAGPPGPGTPIMPSPQGEFCPFNSGRSEKTRKNLLPKQHHSLQSLTGTELTDVDVCVFLFFIIINQIRLVQEGTACTR